MPISCFSASALVTKASLASPVHSSHLPMTVLTSVYSSPIWRERFLISFWHDQIDPRSAVTAGKRCENPATIIPSFLQLGAKRLEDRRCLVVGVLRRVRGDMQTVGTAVKPLPCGLTALVVHGGEV